MPFIANALFRFKKGFSLIPKTFSLISFWIMPSEILPVLQLILFFVILPLHNIKSDVCYPTTLITTASRDDRVVPSHSFKFAAKLQEDQSCNNPILIRIEDRAGHGSGTPKDKIINQISEIYGYALLKINEA